MRSPFGSTSGTSIQPMLSQRSLAPKLAAIAGILPALHLSRGIKASGGQLSTSAETGQETIDLAQWVTAGGGLCQCVQVAFAEETGQTLVTTQAVKKGKLLVSLPKARQLAAESSDQALQALMDRVPSDLWAAKLALPLVAERVKGTSSSFLPYLQSLPSGIPGLPIFFRPGEVQQLQYPPLVQQVNLRCRWLIKFASEAVTSEIEGRSFSGTAVDANLLGWGLGCASSRAFRVFGSAQPRLLPLIDLCNHSFTPNCRLEGAQDGTARLIACQDLAAAEALQIDYGALSNTALLQDYGFIVPENPHDSVQMMLAVEQIQVAQTLAGVGIPKEPESWQADLLARLGADGQGSGVQLRRSDPMFDQRLVAAVRVLCAASAQELQGRDLLQLGDLEVPLAASVEARAMRTLAAMCAQLISAMGTRLDEDRRTLTAEMSTNSTLAVRYRIELKVLIQAALALVLNKLKRLQGVI